MLKGRREERRPPRVDWFPEKVYLHFDGPVSRADATTLVTDPEAVARHPFLPLITFDKRERRFRRKKGTAPKIDIKIRRIAYPSNRDSCIFSYYAHLLNEPYEELIKNLGIDDVVIGYRKIGSNIDLALAAFSEVKTRGSCVAFAFDISGFFDNIDHAILKKNWCRVLNVSELPEDHYKVFRRLTKFSTVNRQACLRRLGEKPSSRDRDIKRRPICSIDQFRNLIRGDDGVSTNLVVPWKREYRIPQGTALSALAANIAMIDFDVEMRQSIVALGGSYRRYSDDILVLVPPSQRDAVPLILRKALKVTTRRLRINAKKTDEIEFVPGALAKGRGTKNLQYLGFLFDGERQLLRPNTLAKYYRRLHRAVASAKTQHKKAAAGKLAGRSNIHRRSLLAKVTHLGTENFITTYAATAQSKSGGQGIRRQLAGHTRKLNALLEH